MELGCARFVENSGCDGMNNWAVCTNDFLSSMRTSLSCRRLRYYATGPFLSFLSFAIYSCCSGRTQHSISMKETF